MSNLEGFKASLSGGAWSAMGREPMWGRWWWRQSQSRYLHGKGGLESAGGEGWPVGRGLGVRIAESHQIWAPGISLGQRGRFGNAKERSGETVGPFGAISWEIRSRKDFFPPAGEVWVLWEQLKFIPARGQDATPMGLPGGLPLCGMLPAFAPRG